MGIKKNILIITPFMPYPLNSGGNIAQFEMIDSIRHFQNIHIVFPLNNQNANDFEVLKSSWTNVTFHPYSKSVKMKIMSVFFRKILAHYFKFLNKLSFTKKSLIDKFILKNTTLFASATTYVDTELVDFLDLIISNNDINIAQIEFYEYITLGAFLKKNKCKIVFVVHELRYVREEREISLLSEISTFIKYNYLKNKGSELSFLDVYDEVLTVTEHDSKELSKYFVEKIIYPSPLTIKYNNSSNNTVYNFKNKLFFLGGDEHFPNKEGITWFLDNCWAKLNVENPGLTLHIIGNWSDESKTKYSNHKNIIFLGFVDSLTDVLKDGIFIVPIRIGSGMRMKIIDAVLNGVPFVTTTIGVEGLNFENQIDCLIGDSYSDFSACIQTLIYNPNLAVQLVNNARETLFAKYSYERLITIRKDFYDSF